MEEDELDFTKLRYVLYARKSTDDPQRQVRSTGDQIAECLDLADRLHLRVVNRNKPLVETKSAKKPRQRKIFNQMLIDLKNGVYDGILAWNPDRLARNMREGGEIIDMIDEGYIKDLKFVTHHFSNDPNGKMLLGMAFVLSKQYSDKLSVDVTRGVRRNFNEGKSAIPKHGYIRNENGFYEPDGKNFDLVKAAWVMRAEGTSLEDITEFMNKNGYSKTVKRTGRKIDMDIKILSGKSGIFKDPFYYGILIQATQKVDLRLIYNFQPATTEEVYNQVQELSGRRLTPYNTRRRMTFYPLKAMVKCSFCDCNMVVGPSTGNTKRYLYYRCNNKFCTRSIKSIRAKVIFDWIYDFLKDGLGLTERDYNNYYNGLTRITDKTRQDVGMEIHSRQARLKVIDREVRERSLELGKGNMLPTVRAANEARIMELDAEKVELSQQIEEFKGKLTNPEDDRLSIEQFLNLSKNAGAIVQKADAMIKDTICREIFLNFVVDEVKVASYQLKPHFAAMLKSKQQPTSRGPGN